VLVAHIKKMIRQTDSIENIQPKEKAIAASDTHPLAR
jgi:hypothetical protein